MGKSVDGKVLFATVLLTSLAANGASVTPSVFIPLTYETDDYEILGNVVPIKYGTGAVLTTLVEDLVMLTPAGTIGSRPAQQAFQQVFGMATQLQASSGSSSSEAPWDGVLGMGRPALAAGRVQLPLLSMYQQGLIKRPAFGLYLVHNASGPGAGGELALGGWNTGRLQGNITWINVVNSQQETQQGYWSIAVDQVQLAWLNGSSTIASGTCGSSSSSCLGLLDSGTAQLVGSIDQVAAVNRAIGAVPSVSQLPFQCNAFVDQVLQATVLAVQGAAPSAAASAVCSKLFGGVDGLDLEVMFCNAVQTELFRATQQTGTPGVPTPAAVELAQQPAAALCPALPYTVNVTVDCNSVQQLPNISFILGGEAFSVSSRQYAYQDPASMKCYSGITSLGSLYPGSWVLGDAFMHNYYTIFDLDPSESSKKNGKSSKNANGRSLSRVGIAQLTAAEQAVQVELFNAAVAGKSSASSVHWKAGSRMLPCVFGLVLVLVLSG